MFRSLILHDIPINAFPAMERWYYRDHSPEIVRRYGPWSQRHESYFPLPVPEEAKQFGYFNWRYTEGWWREIPKAGPQGTLAFVLPPVPPRVAICFTPWQPTEDFLGSDVQSYERPIFRWVLFQKYPESVSVAECEDWFLNTHMPQALKQTGLWRAFSYRAIKDAIRLPGTWPSYYHPPQEFRHLGWDRVTELWYDGYDDWRRSVLIEPPHYTPPPWDAGARYPFFTPRENVVSTFLLERPADEFLRDSRSYL